MTGWDWWAGGVGEDTFDIATASTREEVIRLACREIASGDSFEIVEARSSTDAKYEGADHVPFLRTRNREVLIAGPLQVPA